MVLVTEPRDLDTVGKLFYQQSTIPGLLKMNFNQNQNGSCGNQPPSLKKDIQTIITSGDYQGPHW